MIAGCLAQWVPQPLTVPYLAAPPATAANQPTIPRRTAGLPVPAAAGTLAAFSANGLLAGLSGLFLATTLNHPSHALAGAAPFLVFACGVAAQLGTTRLRASQVLLLGTISLLAGLALFLIGGALIGAGSGAVFKGTTGIALGLARAHLTPCSFSPSSSDWESSARAGPC